MPVTPPNAAKKPPEHESIDSGSERLVLVVVAWLVLAVLLPLHALYIVGLVFAGSVLGPVVLTLVFGLPLLVIDVVAYRWFKDNYSVFRWVNRSGDWRRREKLP